MFVSLRMDDNCLNNLLTSRTEPLKVNMMHGAIVDDCNMFKKKKTHFVLLCGDQSNR